MNSIITEKISTPVRYECDVCVAGGGVAGIAAALSAARAGAKVILLERGFMLGGLATAGIVTIYLALCDGRGHQVTFGIAEELFKLSIEHGAEDRYPRVWLEGGTLEERRAANRFEVQFNPQLFAMSAERVLREAGVKILYGATAVAAPTCDGKITEVVIEGKSGREAIRINKSVVDTTGDADICKLAGEECRIFGGGNVLAAWYYGYGQGRYALNMCGFCDVPEEERAPGQEIPTLVNRRFVGLETEELSDMVQLSHGAIMNSLLRKRGEIPDLVPVTVGTIPQIRMTRRVAGKYTMTVEDEFRHFEDSVGVFSNWKKRGPVYELPLSSLYGERVKNLITAGRCISSDDRMWDVTRVIPVCAVSGEAAGAAAAMSDDFGRMDVSALQAHLRSVGEPVHIAELGELD
ncbi:MAG: FAD-dependent oxidoreductase [Clostridia bacterium]|nr:FAD-dependent oxidoreductase [Clostridia bacterium]